MKRRKTQVCAKKRRAWCNGSAAEGLAANSETRGCPSGASDQGGFVQRKNGLIRNERDFCRDFHQVHVEYGECVVIDSRAIRDGKLQAVVVVMRGFVMILAIAGLGVGIVMRIVIIMEMVCSVVVVCNMMILAQAGRGHPCEHAEGDDELAANDHGFC